MCAVATAGVVLPTGSAQASPPPAPKPTSADKSPSAPDPHPPAGGKAPDGSVPGGPRLASRAIVLPAGAPKLPMNLTARSWVLADLDSGQILAARDPHGRYQPASILKSLTAVTILPNLPGKRVVTISHAAATAEGSAVGLLAGAKYDVDNLFDALMLVSGNDAAVALAEANGGVAKTVAEMNAKAESLGAYDTFVQTPSGLDGWQQLTSSYDMMLVLRAALKLPRFIAYDRLASATYPVKKSKYGKVGVYQFDNQSLDFLRGVPGALVAKTGYTDAAGHTYLCAAERNGRRLGLVMLRNKRTPLDQYQQAAELLDWGFALKPTVQPIGMLAGPISSQPTSGGQPNASGGASAGNQPAAGAKAAPPANAPGRSQPALTGSIGAVVVLVAGGFVGRQARRRRARRQR